MSGSDYIFATATELLTAMKERQISSLEITQAAIEQIERYDPMLNAMCVHDFERALMAAREADEARARGDTRTLLGVPMTVKESFNIGGLPTTWGIPPFKEFTPKEDALAVARVKSAGAVILGKTNVPVALGDLQTYNPLYGTTNNPWDVSRTPGGSSGGSAAALAAGYGALSIGSDIAGSLRVPAHCCGVFAHKPTFGLLPGRGHTQPPAPPIPTERDLTVIGPMARSAADLALLFELLAKPDMQTIGKAYRVALHDARHENLADYRVLMIDSHPCIPTSASVRTTIKALAHHLDQAGAKVMRASALLPDLAEGARIYMRLLMSSMAASLPAEIYQRMRADAAAFDENDRSLAAERTRGAVMSHRDWLIVDSHRAQLREQWRALFSEFDVVLCPVMPTPAFHHDHSPDQWRRSINIDGAEHNYGDQLVWSGIATAPGLPATVLPIGRCDNGLPIGAQVIGPMYEDRTTLRFAALVERELGGFIPPPLNKQ
jgi:amidase